MLNEQSDKISNSAYSHNGHYNATSTMYIAYKSSYPIRGREMVVSRVTKLRVKSRRLQIRAKVHPQIGKLDNSPDLSAK